MEGAEVRSESAREVRRWKAREVQGEAPGGPAISQLPINRLPRLPDSHRSISRLPNCQSGWPDCRTSRAFHRGPRVPSTLDLPRFPPRTSRAFHPGPRHLRSAVSNSLLSQVAVSYLGLFGHRALGLVEVVYETSTHPHWNSRVVVGHAGVAGRASAWRDGTAPAAQRPAVRDFQLSRVGQDLHECPPIR